MLRDAFISGAVEIANKRREVDELNVYPVPDGDTGTNMSMTMNNALKELQRIDDNADVSAVADLTASALLRGARGNSGVILSLLFRGFSKGLQGKKEAGCEELKNALKLGVEAAYKAVMKPTEGTILTVARMASEKAEVIYKTAENEAGFWEEICLEAKTALDKTPEQLPVLKKAGVVDAGGMGLYVIFTAMLQVFKGKKTATAESTNKSEPIIINGKNSIVDVIDEEITFTYCTEFIARKTPECSDVTRLRAFLETIGDCVVVVDDDDIIKVHVHTDHPGNAIEQGLLFGSLINLKVENMRYQYENRVKEASLAKAQNFTPVQPEKPFGFVAVASGRGIEELFTNLGADCIVRGGQTMNPSTDDILQAVYSVPAETVFVLPNNKNIIMAAEQAVKLADRNVCVIQSRTIPQGMSAMLGFDAEADFDTNRLNMSKAVEKVQTGLITFAARDSDFDGHDIKQGEILALENGRLSFTEKDINKAAFKLTKKLAKNDAAFITVIYGADVTDEKADELHQLLQNKLGQSIEIMMVNGGQPVYYYIISVE